MQPLAPPAQAVRGLLAAAPWAAIAVVYAPVLAHAVDVWRSDEELSFGFAAVPAAAALLALRRHAVRGAAGPGRTAGLAILAAGLVLLVAGARGDVNALAGASFLPVVLGAVVYLHGVGAARLVAFPAALATVSLALYRGLLAPLGFVLQQLTAQASAASAGLAGVPVRRSGVDLFTANVHLVVAQACSGMDSLLALLCLGAVFVSLVRAPLARRLLLLALVLPIVLAANVLRVTLVLVLSEPFGRAVTEGPSHDLLGASLFVAATCLFLAAGLAVRPRRQAYL